MQWYVLYDARNETPSGLIFPVLGPLVLAVALIRLRWRIPPHYTGAERAAVKRPRRWFVAGAAALTLASALATITPHQRMVRALRAGDAVRVEGAVEDFEAGNVLVKRPERWTVSGHRYTLQPSRSQPGFNEPGVVHPGQRLRIADVHGRIARIEAAR